jgi:hypothetical protein
MPVLSGTGIGRVLVMIAGFWHKGGPAAVRQIAGAALYLDGCGWGRPGYAGCELLWQAGSARVASR